MKIGSPLPICLAAASIILAACDPGAPEPEEASSPSKGGSPAETVAQAQAAAPEKAPVFETLFDGSGLEGWKQSGNWAIESDESVSRKEKGGSLVYAAKPVPDDFELRFEWKVARGSNSGVYYRPSQYEYQVLDNATHKDGANPQTSAASLYFCMQPSRNATKPVGEWNTARVVCKGAVVQHWLNGEKVVGFDYSDPKWAFHVDLLKRRGGDLTARGANLSLQDYGDPVWYRNIYLRELVPDDAIGETPVTPGILAPEILAAEKIKLEGIIAKREAQKKKAAAEAAAQALKAGISGQKPKPSNGAKPKKRR